MTVGLKMTCWRLFEVLKISEIRKARAISFTTFHREIRLYQTEGIDPSPRWTESNQFTDQTKNSLLQLSLFQFDKIPAALTPPTTPFP